MLYPLLFEPNLHPTVWGGKQIRTYKNLQPSDEPIGESWEVSVVPSSVSIISNGAFRGMPLDRVVREQGADLLGKSVFEQYKGEFPLLVKFIDAADDLSIQVHPNDEMSQRVEGKNGKTECWYIIKAEPGAYLYAGMKENISQDEYVKRVEDGTICDVLAKHQVKTGDVFYLPAGRVHAIGGGILLAEVQQNSDVTYRIFDYNRPGLDGKPRQLHTDKALQAIDFSVQDEYRTIYNNAEQRANPCIESPFFTMRIVVTNRPFHRNLLKYDSFIVTMCIEGDCTIQVRSTGDSILLKEGHSCLIPASIADYDIIPQNGMGTTRLLDAYINNSKNLINKANEIILFVRDNLF